MIFNAIIDNLELKEIELSGRQFTWANNLDVPTYEKLDRILINTEWEFKYPLSTVQALTREISDHTPLLLDTGSPNLNRQHLFKFELGWLLRDGFYEIVENVWKSEEPVQCPLQNWQNRIRRLRQFLRGWAKNISGAYKKEKKEIMRRVEQLDIKAETVLLQPQEINLKHCLKERLV